VTCNCKPFAFVRIENPKETSLNRVIDKKGNLEQPIQAVQVSLV